jgi:predicted transposase/invertase (TIGR01784 family)
MFTELNNVTSRFILKEKDFLIDYPIYDIELIFVELPKFKKQLPELGTIVDKWLYFLKEARYLSEVPEVMSTVPEIKKAFYIANQINLTPEELDDQEKSEFFIQDQRGAVTKSLKQGIEQGLQQGIEQGIQQGIQQNKVEMAKKMLSVMDDRTICEIIGLSMNELEDLKTSKP